MTRPDLVLRLPQGRRAWALRGLLVLFLLVAGVVVWVSNIWLTDRFTETTRNRAELRLALYSGSIMSELQRNSVVPLLLARDPTLASALSTQDYSQTSQRLMSYREEIGAASIVLLDRDGRVVATTDRFAIGESHADKAYFADALGTNGTIFTTSELDTGAFDFTFSRRIDDDALTLGVILVRVDLTRLTDRWRGTSEAVFVANSEGRIILSTEPRWRGHSEAEAVAVQSPDSAIDRAIEAAGDWAFTTPNPYFGSAATLRLESRIPFRGWSLVSYSAYDSVRERVNGLLALEIMGFALLLAGAFYVLSRRARLQSVIFQRESAELRRLNDRLQREIAERQKAEKNLQEAEASLAQSSKLAALGEMSAAVSHELNQPLAAMKTYLAGAKLLLHRRRTEEALSSFQRIDDLIERMGAITRQLKSYARKGGDAFQEVDMRAALSSALTMMEPQLRQMTVEITQTIPPAPVRVTADRLRLEQVIINLIRNALDAMKGEDRRALDLILAEGDEVVLTVRDNGRGIDDLDALFEPFYTTKQPGDGIGLGLAISSGIVKDFGGRLTARNGEAGGAVFEVRLPRADRGSKAAAE